MKRIFSLVMGICLMVSCSKSSVEQEQDLCKDAKSVSQIIFVKLSNTYSNRVNLLGYNVKQDSIAMTFKYQDSEADLGTNISQKIVNADGSRETGYVEIFKKNADGTFSKLVFQETLNFSLVPVPTQGGQVVSGSNYPLRITSLSSCSGEITFSTRFELSFLSNIGLKLNDKIKFQIYLKDRALHISNIIETTETTLSENRADITIWAKSKPAPKIRSNKLNMCDNK